MFNFDPTDQPTDQHLLQLPTDPHPLQQPIDPHPPPQPNNNLHLPQQPTDPHSQPIINPPPRLRYYCYENNKTVNKPLELNYLPIVISKTFFL